VERMTVKVLHGAPDQRETAVLMAVLTAALGRAARVRQRRGQGPYGRREFGATAPAWQPFGATAPAWQPFGGHVDGGWGRP
jgi:hypothetical protein